MVQLKVSLLERRSPLPEVKYSKAISKLDEIIKKIESEEIDIDELSAKVKEAVGLIAICQEKIKKAEMEVKQVVDRLEKGASL
jgi:exodeoxyribonuclease VII small subunit